MGLYKIILSSIYGLRGLCDFKTLVINVQRNVVNVYSCDIPGRVNFKIPETLADSLDRDPGLNLHDHHQI